MRTTHKKIASVVTAALAIANFPATAQAVDKPSQAKSEIESIVVTAQKREQSVQEIPISISAFNGNALKELGLNETDELGQFVPGLEISTSSGEGSQLIIFLRGAGLSDFNVNNAGPIGIYSDEVYISSPALTAFQFFDTQRLEILKGPQGTLYGRNTTGGAIKFVSNKPTEELEFSGRASFGSFSTSVVEAAVSGGFSDNVRGRFAFIKNDGDGHMRNLGDPLQPTNGEDDSKASGVDSLSYRGLLEFDYDKLNVLVNIHGVDLKSPATSFRPLGTLDEVGNPCSSEAIRANQCFDFLGYRSPDDPLTGFYDSQKEISLESTGGYIEVNYEAGDLTFTSISAYDEIERFLPEETDGGPAKILDIVYGVKSETFSQEFRLTGGSDKLEWLVGAFYLTEDLESDQTVDVFAEFKPLLGGASDPAGITLGAPVLLGRSNNFQDIESYAVFGQASFELTDDLTITLGARYTEEERKFSAKTQLENDQVESEFVALVDENTGEVLVSIPYGGDLDPLVLYERPNLKSESDAFSYRVAVDYKIEPNMLTYASISRGYKSGGFNGGFLALDPAQAEVQLTPFDPEYLTAYEVGFKSDLLDSKLRFNAAIFFNDFTDLQVFSLFQTDLGPVVLLDNASDAEVTGLEFDITAILAEGLTAALSAAFMDSKLKNFQGAGGDDLSGNQLANTPDTSLSFLLRYEHYLNSGAMISGQAAVAYKDDLFFTTENDPVTRQNAHTLTNARVTYENKNGQWQVALFVNNLTDEFYTTNVSNTSSLTGTYTQTVGLPRTVGIEFSVNY